LLAVFVSMLLWQALLPFCLGWNALTEHMTSLPAHYFSSIVGLVKYKIVAVAFDAFGEVKFC